MRSIRACVAVSWFALALVACGEGGHADTGAGGAGSTGSGGNDSAGNAGRTNSAGAAGAMSEGARFLHDYASAVCAMYEPCCRSEQLGFDQAGCTEWFQKVSAAYWKGAFRPDQGAACLQALADARAADAARCSTVPLFDEATLRARCEDAFGPPERAGKPLGESCLLSSDCASTGEGSVLCYSSNCILQRRGQPGDGPCSLSGSDGIPTESFACEPKDNLYCDQVSNTCATRVGDGEPCPNGNSCVASAMCTGGICRRLPDVGEPCLNGVPGAGGFCRAGSVCDRTALVCGPGYLPGDKCSDETQCQSGVCTSGTCARSDFSKNLNCTGPSR